MLDETWGLSNHTRKYDGKYSDNGSNKNQNMAVALKHKFGKGSFTKHFLLFNKYFAF